MRRPKAITQRFLAQRVGDDEPAVDETGVLDRQYVGMVETGRQPDLFAECLERVLCHEAGMREFQRDRNAGDRIVGLCRRWQSRLRPIVDRSGTYLIVV